MMTYTITIDQRAIEDIQKAINYYDNQQVGLGEYFESSLNTHLETLAKNPIFIIRYDNVRCLPMKKFPYMVHFTVDETKQIVSIHAVFHTSLDDIKWNK